LAKKYNLKSYSAGELLRQQAGLPTRRGRKIAKKINQGKLVSDKIVVSILKEKIRNTPNNFILDGVPRDKNQAKKLKIKLDAVISISSSKKNILQRLKKRKRKDDSPIGIQNRMQVYNKKTKPILDYFKKKGIPIIIVKGDQTINQVHKELVRKLNAKIQVH